MMPSSPSTQFPNRSGNWEENGDNHLLLLIQKKGKTMIFFEKKISDLLKEKGLKKHKDTTISYAIEWVDLPNHNKLMITPASEQPFGVRVEAKTNNAWQKIRSFRQLQELINLNLKKEKKMKNIDIDSDFLSENGEKIESALEGTCMLYEYDGVEYVVLQDDSVITREEDNSSEEAVFPY